MTLLREHGDDLVWLRIYLASVMHEALGDLCWLNPHETPTPAVVWSRFLAWAAPPTVADGRFSPADGEPLSGGGPGDRA